jgi:hypothetical protein
MKTLREYIAESAEWMESPAEGDSFAFELPDETICETYIIEIADDCILLDSTEEINQALSEWAALEDTDEGDSGVIMETMGYGGLVGEDNNQIAKYADEFVNTYDPESVEIGKRFCQHYNITDRDDIQLAIEIIDHNVKYHKETNTPIDLKKIKSDVAKAFRQVYRGMGPGPGPFKKKFQEALEEGNIEDLEKNIASAAVKPIPMEEGQMKQQMMDNAERMSLEQFTDLYGDDEWVIEFWKDFNESDDIAEAEYRGRKVPLGKPMRGDVKKFKVYVKDPKTGNVKKVNFGHGGTSAKRAGQKTMKIKKSNPARRKSFRARHNCANPGPRTKARYWSCRAW